MVRSVLLACVMVFAQFAAVAQSAAPPASVRVTGLDHQTITLSGADLAQLSRHTVQLDVHGHTHVFSGPLLADILARVHAPNGETLRGADLTDVVLVAARDGYQVALTLGEIDSALGAKTVILADIMDGAAITAANGPFQLVVEGDHRPARAARMVTSITLVRAH